MLYLFVFVDNVRALKDVSLLGDYFLGEIFPSLQAILAQAHQQKKSPPYFYRYYNVETRYQCPMNLNRSILSRLLNCFIELLNKNQHLPRYIFIIIDKDWFETSGIVEFGAQMAITQAVQWWLKEINKFIAIRKDHLYNKKPGTLSSSSEPRLIWVAMIKRPIV